MKLSHGTTRRHLSRILEHGLLPREILGDKCGNFEEYPSGEDRVYLSNCYSPYFAMMLGEPMLVEVEVDEDNLYPDEDFLSQAVRDVKQTHSFRDSIYDYQHHAMDSLEHLGTVAHVGEIEVSRITSIWTFEESMLAVCDPTISILNHSLFGSYYRKLTDWFLGADEYPTDFFGGPPDDRLCRWFEKNASKRKKLK